MIAVMLLVCVPVESAPVIEFQTPISDAVRSTAQHEVCSDILREARLLWEAELTALRQEVVVLRTQLAAALKPHRGARTYPREERARAEVSLHSPPRRLLLEEAEGFCSTDELLMLSGSDNLVKAIMVLLESNSLCAMCLIPCNSAKDSLVCALACIKQEEGMCTEADRNAIAVVGMPSSLADRAQLVRILEESSRACVVCILETIVSVCGAQCVVGKLHIQTDNRYGGQPCLPELAASLAAGEGAALALAAQSNDPFAIVGAGPVDDVYAPMSSPSVYAGIESGLFAYTCDPAIHGPVMAFSPTLPDTLARQECSGELRIDLTTGRATHANSAVPFRSDLQWAGCSIYLPFDRPDPSVPSKSFAASSPMEAACWLSRFFGPQTTWIGPSTFSVEVASDFALQTDLVIRSGTTLRIESATNTKMVIGAHQIRVNADARLDLRRMTVADSVLSTALVVTGSASLRDCAFIRCNATTNVVLSGIVERLVPDGVGAFLAAAGAAIYVGPAGSLSIVDSALLECWAVGGKIGNLGAAIFANTGAQLELVNAELRNNSVQGGEYGCGGGALWLHISTNCTVHGSTISGNVATGGNTLSAGGAAVLLTNAHLVVVDSTVCDNSAILGGQYSEGGGFFVYSESQLRLRGSYLCRNTAMGDADFSAGGAVALWVQGKLDVLDCEFSENTVQGSQFAQGGAMTSFQNGKATFQRTLFRRNSASGARSANNGGSLFFDAGCTVSVRDSALRENHVNGLFTSYGGGIFTSADRLTLANTSLSWNHAASSKTTARGGALYVNAGTVLLRDGCLLHNNRAESVTGQSIAAIGGMHSYARVQTPHARTHAHGCACAHTCIHTRCQFVREHTQHRRARARCHIHSRTTRMCVRTRTSWATKLA